MKAGMLRRMTSSTRAITLMAASALLALMAGCAAMPQQHALRPTLETRAADRDLGHASTYGLYLGGVAAIDRGSSKDAAFYFARASESDPTSASLRARAFTAALVAGEVPTAARLAKGAEGEAPIMNLSRLVRAVDAMADGEGKDAQALLTSEPNSADHAPVLALLRPWAAAEAGDWATAEKLPDVGGNPVLVTVSELGRAEIFEANGKFPEAESAFKLRTNPKNGLFVLGYGAFLERRGRTAEAIALYEKAVAAKPGDPSYARALERAKAHKPAPPAIGLKEGSAEALIAPAVLMLAQHQGDSGLGYLRLALRLDPNLDEAWVLVGDAMSAAGDPDAAREAYNHVKPGSDQYITARNDLAIALQKDGDKDAALALARETMKSEPGDPRLLTLYADLLSDDEKYVEAAGVLDKAIAAVGENNAGWTLFYLRGAAEERSGRWPAAEADLKRALKLKPNEPEVMNYLGYAWVDRGEHLTEALALLEKAEALSPDNGAIVDSLGWARYRAHDYRKAISDLERAIELDPSDPEVNDHLGDVYWQVGRRLEAQYQWRRVLTLDPDAKRRAAVEAKLKNGLQTTEAVNQAVSPVAPVGGVAHP
jgi:tetratricopeptide (TPR) repeat protein